MGINPIKAGDVLDGYRNVLPALQPGEGEKIRVFCEGEVDGLIFQDRDGFLTFQQTESSAIARLARVPIRKITEWQEAIERYNAAQAQMREYFDRGVTSPPAPTSTE